MSYRKIYSYDDLDLFYKECSEILSNILKELNKNKPIIQPSKKEYEKILEDTLEKVSNVVRCSGMYLSGKHKGKRCQAPPYENSKYCLNHKNQDPKNKQSHELNIKSLQDTIESIRKNKQPTEAELKALEDSIESLKKFKLDE
jgi:hypothetical protein